jgi:hypothetical protein
MIWETAPVGNSMHQTTDYYKGAVITNTTNSEFRRVTSFKYIGLDSATNLQRAIIKFDRPWPDTTIPTNVLTISDPSDMESDVKPVFFVPDGSDNPNAYDGCLLYVATTPFQSRPIRGYDPVTRIITLNTDGNLSIFGGPITNWNTEVVSGVELRIIGKRPVTNGTLVSGAVTSATAILANTASVIDGFYNGKYLYLTGVGVGEVESLTPITAYTGLTQTVTLQSNIVMRGSDRYDIITIDRDNEVPLPISTLNAFELYDVQLLSLIIPNKVLDGGFGGLPSQYPYLYVKFKNTRGGQGPWMLYSNNPNAVSKLFRVGMYNTPATVNSDYVRLNGRGAVQRFMFNPSKEIEFGVYMPNGDTFKVKKSETFSPQTYMSDIQISACFAIKKVV